MSASSDPLRWVSRLCIASATILATGCGTLSKPYPDKSLYAFHLGEVTSAAAPPVDVAPAGDAEPNGAAVRGVVLRVERVRVSAPFDAPTIMNRVGPSKYQADYYNGFVTAPARLLTDEVARFLSKAKVFENVVSGESAADYQWALEALVTELYADRRPGQPQQAVIAVRFIVIDQSGGRYAIVFDRSYQDSEPISGTGTDPLITAWDAAATRIMNLLAQDLCEIPATTKAGSTAAHR